jgi:transcriptional regulator with XRE-family HTH domain
MDFIIGAEIKSVLKESRMKNAEFAEAMNMEERNLYHFFKKTELTLDQLLKASQVLDYDFVSLYLNNKRGLPKYRNYSLKEDQEIAPGAHESSQDYEKKRQISFSVNILGEIDRLQKEFPAFLEEIQRAAEARGLRLA